jgi:hypothetical protein
MLQYSNHEFSSPTNDNPIHTTLKEAPFKMTVRNHGVYSQSPCAPRYPIEFPRFKNTDGFVCCRYRLFAEQVPQGNYRSTTDRPKTIDSQYLQAHFSAPSSQRRILMSAPLSTELRQEKNVRFPPSPYTHESDEEK